MARKKYLKSSEDAKKQLVVFEKEIATIKHRLDDTKRKMIRFLNKREADEFTKSLYQNGISFNPKTIIVSSERLNLLNKEFQDLTEIYTGLLRKEAMEDFILENPEVKGTLKDIVIERSASGSHARVLLK